MYHIMNHGEKHIACVLLVDVSGSMSGDAIRELNEGLRVFGEALKSDSKAYGCADVCVISFGSKVEQVVPFCPAAEYVAPVLTAGGLTVMNEAVITGLDMIELRKQEYKDVGVDYWRPWVFLLTDGVPTDNDLYQDAQQRLQEALANKKINFFPMGIGSGADTQTLKKYTKNGSGMVLKASKENFQEAFVWLSSSMSVVSNSDPAMNKVELEPLPNTITVEL